MMTHVFLQQQHGKSCGKLVCILVTWSWVCHTPAAVLSKVPQFWVTAPSWCYAGNMVHLDFHLCESEYRSRLLATRTGASFEMRLNNIKDLLDTVYFFWYQERDLARGAKFLAKVVGCSCSLPKVMMLL